MGWLNLACIRPCTRAEGPGQRFAIWVQGCTRRCKGCCNPEMQEIRPNYVVDTRDIIKLIACARQKYEIEGVTFIGGEPFLQAEGCGEVAAWCQENGMSVLTFSGFLYQELKEMKDAEKLLGHTDILVDGPFIQEQYEEERDWIGSANQKVWYLSDRYTPEIERSEVGQQMEICVSTSRVLINGWPFQERDASV